MLSSIHPLGERARNNRWGITISGFVLAAVMAGGIAAGLLGALGSLLPGGSWRLPTALALALAAGTADLVRIPPPGPRRQVNEDWIGAFRGWVYGVGFGVQLGMGAATYVVTWGVWATALIALVSGSLATGAVIGATFGLGRALAPLAAGWIDRPSRLTAFNRAMASWASPVARSVGVAMVMVAVAGTTWRYL